MTRIDLTELRTLAEAATPGPWHWSGNAQTQSIGLYTWIPGYGRCVVMRFKRWGLSGAQPQFMTDLMCVDARDLVTYEVGPRGIRGRDAFAAPGVYRYDIDGIDHPTAQYIAAANPATVLRLLDALEAVLELADGWTARGEHLMAYSKTVPEEVGTPLLENGAEFVERARILRSAITTALGADDE